MLVKYQSPRSLFNLNNADHFLNDFFSNQSQDLQDQEISPRINVEENDNEWVISAELPGVLKEDVNVNFQDNVLSISGEKKIEDKDESKNYHRFERSSGKFNRSLKVNTSVVAEKIKADYKDGILTITLPKAEEAKPKSIDISVK